MLRTRVKVSPISGVLLGCVTALLLVAIHTSDRWFRALTPVLGQPAKITLRLPHSALELWEDKAASPRIIPAGTLLRATVPAHVRAIELESERRPPATRELLALFAMFSALVSVLSLYLRKFGHSRLRLLRPQVGLAVSLIAACLVAKAILLFTALPEYVVPAAIVPLWVAVCFDRRAGAAVAVVLSLLLGSLLYFDGVFVCLLLAGSIAATFVLQDGRGSRQLLAAGVVAGVTGACTLFAMRVAFSVDFVKAFDGDLASSAGAGVLSGALASVLLSLAERLLGEVPREQLLDLTALEQPLLQKMAAEAPGSWEHARAMANLAEAAASAIGADALLTRVGAYYHDLGKTFHPKYFIENLEPGEPSPHDNLEPDVSANAIMAHVVMGTTLLREGGVPEPVVEFAYTHHGTQLVEYFFSKCQEMGNPKGLPESAFRYRGMKPQSRETAILMLVDSIEAASRTIDPPERGAFEIMIQRIIFTKLKSGQLDESGLNVEDLRILITRMTDMLVNMHHHRIKYPWQKRHAEEFGVPLGTVGPPSPHQRVAELGEEKDASDEDPPSQQTARSRRLFRG